MKRTLTAVSLAAILMAGLAVIGATIAAAPPATWSRQPLTGFVAVSRPSEAVEAAISSALDAARESSAPTPAAVPTATPPPTPDPTRKPRPEIVAVAGAQSVTTTTVVTRTPPPPPPPPAPRPAPPAPRPVSAPAGGATVAQARAYALAQIGSAQFSCLDALWIRESNWNPYATNRSSGAYGIPQALPGSKMATAGADWAPNPVTQVRWGLGYVNGRYGSACAAWSFWQVHHWY